MRHVTSVVEDRQGTGQGGAGPVEGDGITCHGRGGNINALDIHMVLPSDEKLGLYSSEWEEVPKNPKREE